MTTLPPTGEGFNGMSKTFEFSMKDILSRVTPTPFIDNGMSDKEKISVLTELFGEVLTVLGMDLTTIASKTVQPESHGMYVNEIFRGLNVENFPKLTAIENEMGYDQMLVVRDIAVISTCEHHFVTIDGRATIAYIPKEKVIGLSKINRIADFFARRPQVQERLTKQIADCLEDVLGTDDVAVHINAKHYCVISRGIEDHSSTTITSDLRGAFKEDSRTRAEFLLHCATKI